MNNPYYNLEGLGIQFVASPRHADMLLVTGPVSRHMEVALRRTYDATPEPKLVVAVGDCGCSGGLFGESYASCGRVSNVIPVDVAVPGCPPTPLALMQGILTAISGAQAGANRPGARNALKQ
jgi:Ni,Fe-hydrogenase III small subunit